MSEQQSNNYGGQRPRSRAPTDAGQGQKKSELGAKALITVQNINSASSAQSSMRRVLSKNSRPGASESGGGDSTFENIENAILLAQTSREGSQELKRSTLEPTTPGFEAGAQEAELQRKGTGMRAIIVENVEVRVKHARGYAPQSPSFNQRTIMVDPFKNEAVIMDGNSSTRQQASLATSTQSPFGEPGTQRTAVYERVAEYRVSKLEVYRKSENVQVLEQQVADPLINDGRNEEPTKSERRSEASSRAASRRRKHQLQSGQTSRSTSRRPSTDRDGGAKRSVTPEQLASGQVTPAAISVVREPLKETARGPQNVVKSKASNLTPKSPATQGVKVAKVRISSNQSERNPESTLRSRSATLERQESKEMQVDRIRRSVVEDIRLNTSRSPTASPGANIDRNREASNSSRAPGRGSRRSRRFSGEKQNVQQVRRESEGTGHGPEKAEPRRDLDPMTRAKLKTERISRFLNRNEQPHARISYVFSAKEINTQTTIEQQMLATQALRTSVRDERQRSTRQSRKSSQQLEDDQPATVAPALNPEEASVQDLASFYLRPDSKQQKIDELKASFQDKDTPVNKAFIGNLRSTSGTKEFKQFSTPPKDRKKDDNASLVFIDLSKVHIPDAKTQPYQEQFQIQLIQQQEEPQVQVLSRNPSEEAGTPPNHQVETQEQPTEEATVERLMNLINVQQRYESQTVVDQRPSRREVEVTSVNEPARVSRNAQVQQARSKASEHSPLSSPTRLVLRNSSQRRHNAVVKTRPPPEPETPPKKIEIVQEPPKPSMAYLQTQKSAAHVIQPVHREARQLHTTREAQQEWDDEELESPGTARDPSSEAMYKAVNQLSMESAAAKDGGVAEGERSRSRQNTVRPLGRALNIMKYTRQIQKRESSSRRRREAQVEEGRQEAKGLNRKGRGDEGSESPPGRTEEMMKHFEKVQKPEALSQISCLKDDAPEVRILEEARATNALKKTGSPKPVESKNARTLRAVGSRRSVRMKEEKDQEGAPKSSTERTSAARQSQRRGRKKRSPSKVGQSPSFRVTESYLQSTKHNFLAKKASKPALNQPEFNTYIGEGTFKRTEADYKQGLEALRQRRLKQIKSTLRNSSNKRPRPRQESLDASAGKEATASPRFESQQRTPTSELASRFKATDPKAHKEQLLTPVQLSKQYHGSGPEQSHKLQDLRDQYSHASPGAAEQEDQDGLRQEINADPYEQPRDQEDIDKTRSQRDASDTLKNVSLTRSKQSETNRSAHSQSQSARTWRTPRALRHAAVHGQSVLKSTLINEVIESEEAEERGTSGIERELKSSVPEPARSQSEFSLKVSSLGKLKQIQGKASMDVVNVRKSRKERSLSRTGSFVGSTDRSGSQKCIMPFLTAAQMAASYASTKPEAPSGELQAAKARPYRYTALQQHSSAPEQDGPPQKFTFSRPAVRIAAIEEENEPLGPPSRARVPRKARQTQKLRPSANVSKDEVEVYAQYLHTFEMEAQAREDTVVYCQSIATDTQVPSVLKTSSTYVAEDGRASSPRRGLNGSCYATLPSSQREVESFKQYALRSSLNQMEPQLQKYKLRQESKSSYQKQRESALVAILTTSVYGEPKLFDLRQTVQQKAAQRSQWRSILAKEKLQTMEEPNSPKTAKRQMIRSHQVIYLLLLKYLEGCDPAGPSIHTFKMAFLNKKMMKIIMAVYRIDDLRRFAEFEARQRMVRVLESEPNFDKYGRSSRALKTVKAAWSSPVFGGPVFSPIRAARTGIGGLKERRPDGKKIEKKNSLREYIYNMPVDTHRGGGFYTLRNVKASTNTFLDIEILIEGGINDKKDRKLLREWQRLSLKESKLLPPPRAAYNLLKPVVLDAKRAPRRVSPPQRKSEAIARQGLPKIDESDPSAKSFVPLAATPDLWTQGLRFASPQEAHGRAISPRKPRPRQSRQSSSRPKESKATPTKQEVSDSSACFLRKDEIKHLLNGVARIVEYGTNHKDKQGNHNPTVDSKQNFILSLSEGQFNDGLFSGFTRCIDSEGDCMVGFWRVSEPVAGRPQVSRPFGKFAQYFKDGSFKNPDGIYCGSERLWNNLVKKQMITDFAANEAPRRQRPYG